MQGNKKTKIIKGLTFIIALIIFYGLTYEIREGHFKEFLVVMSIVALVGIISNSILDRYTKKLEMLSYEQYILLKKEDIVHISDEELMNRVGAWINNKYDVWNGYYFDVISSMEEPCINILTIAAILEETRGHSLGQVDFIGSERFIERAISAFQAINAEEFVQMMDQANKVYKEVVDKNQRPGIEQYELNKEESYIRYLYEGELTEAFINLDKEFKELMEKIHLNELCVDYIRKNSEYFGD